MTDPGKAVFLSYASQDAAAAARIAEALRSAGVEVWFDQNELVGGDAWDQKIRRQIKECALFVPLISTATNARAEGYFRLEWKLAVDRSHLLADDHPFLFPIVIGDVTDAAARVPDKFREVQWTRLRLDETPGELAARVVRLLGGGGTSPRESGDKATPELGPPGKGRKHDSRPAWLRHAWSVFGLAIAVYFVFGSIWRKSQRTESVAIPATVATPVAPPEPGARQLVAKAWTLLNKPEMARAELDAADALCKRAAVIDPTDAEVWSAWAHVNIWYCFHNLDNSASRRTAARDCAMRAMQLAPQSFESRLALAFYGVRGDPESPGAKDAPLLLRQLLVERPDEPRVLFSLGFALTQSKATFAEGIGLLERLARNPAFAAVAWDEIGWSQYFMQDFAAAEAAANRSLAVQPYWNNLGLKITLAERVHGDLDEAEAALRQMPASAMLEDWGIGFACEVYQWRREPLRAIQVLNGVPRDWIHYFFYSYPKAFLLGEARLMAQQNSAARGDFQRALALIEEKLADDPNALGLLVLKAIALHRLGEQAQAEKVYRLIRELGDPSSLRITFEPPADALAYVKAMSRNSDDVMMRTFFTPASLRLDPTFDPLRREPGFAALLQELEAKP